MGLTAVVITGIKSLGSPIDSLFIEEEIIPNINTMNGRPTHNNNSNNDYLPD